MVPQILVKDDIGILSFLGQFSGGNRVASQQFVGEALSALVHQDRAVAADGFGDQHGSGLLHRRVQLDLLDIDQVRAQGLGHDDAVAGRAGRVGGHGAFQVWPVLGVHLLIGAEAAGRQDNRLAVEGIVCVLALGFHAADLSVRVDQQFRGCGVVHDADAQFLQFALEVIHQESAHAGAVFRCMDPVHGGAAREGNFRQGRVNRIQPVDRVGGTVGQFSDKFRIVQRMAALHGIRRKQRF